MLLELARWLQGLEDFFGLFNYLTFRGILAALTALALSLWWGPAVIRRLAQYKGGQPIRDDGPKTHFSKAGTPTMGGALILISVLASVLLWGDLRNKYVWVVLAVMVAFGAIGWYDDWIKIVHRDPNGLKSRWKYLLQSIFGLAAGLFLFLTADVPAATTFYIPLFKAVALPMAAFSFVLIAYLWIVGFSNAVNLTDGLDGLATGASIFVFAAYTLVSIWQMNQNCQVLASVGPGCYEVRDPRDLAMITAAIVGACFGFLWWNASPAKIFMGDTGALALGGALAGLTILTRTEILGAIIGGLFVIIIISDVIQIGFFKATGRRVFKMAPLHHHFELMGWGEVTIVIRFWIIAALFAGAGFGLFYADWVWVTQGT